MVGSRASLRNTTVRSSAPLDSKRSRNSLGLAGGDADAHEHHRERLSLRRPGPLHDARRQLQRRKPGPGEDGQLLAADEGVHPVDGRHAGLDQLLGRQARRGVQGSAPERPERLADRRREPVQRRPEAAEDAAEELAPHHRPGHVALEVEPGAARHEPHPLLEQLEHREALAGVDDLGLPAPALERDLHLLAERHAAHVLHEDQGPADAGGAGDGAGERAHGGASLADRRSSAPWASAARAASASGAASRSATRARRSGPRSSSASAVPDWSRAVTRSATPQASDGEAERLLGRAARVVLVVRALPEHHLAQELGDGEHQAVRVLERLGADEPGDLPELPVALEQLERPGADRRPAGVHRARRTRAWSGRRAGCSSPPSPPPGTGAGGPARRRAPRACPPPGAWPGSPARRGLRPEATPR